MAPGGGDLTPAALRAQAASFYAGDKLVTVAPAGVTPDVKRHGTRAHGVTIGGWSVDPVTRRVAVVSVIDNLLKGAATQAVQNINIALALGEYSGIPLGGGK